MTWRITKKTNILNTPPFDVEEISILDTASNNPLTHPYSRIQTADWINVVAQERNTSKLILVEQMRAGSFTFTLETPGGVVDKHEHPLETAKRELEEETGFISASWQFITDISPNPALMCNRLHIYLARGCYINCNRRHFPDANEDISVIKLSISELDKLIKTTNKFDNALSLLSYSLAHTLLEDES